MADKKILDKSITDSILMVLAGVIGGATGVMYSDILGGKISFIATSIFIFACIVITTVFIYWVRK